MFVTGNLKRAYTLSWIVAVVTAVASLAGLIYRTTLYPTEELRQAYVINDVLNLIIGLPMLLGSMWLDSRAASLAGRVAVRRIQLHRLYFWDATKLERCHLPRHCTFERLCRFQT
jgi:hypothetical protein